MYQPLQLEKSRALYREAQMVIPGGVLGLRAARFYLSDNFPIFFKTTQGEKVWDMDGNAYIDMICSYGLIIIDYKEKELDEAKAESTKKLRSS